MRRLRVTLVVDVAVPEALPPHPPVTDDESAAALVDAVARRALEREGLAPVSGGYGYERLDGTV